MKLFITFIFSCILFLPMGTICAQNHVGIILSGHEKDCEVTHNGKAYQCGERRQLYLGDLIMKKPSIKMLKIKWAPYVNGATKSETVMEVASNQPEKFKGNRFSSGLKQYIDDFVKPTEYGAIPLVTRARKTKMPWPLYATLMQGYPIKVSGENEGIRSIDIIDGKGQKVYEKLIKSKEAISLIPGEIGINPLEPYTVYINKDNSKRKLDIMLMDGTTQEEILNGLADIDKENITKPDNLIKKAVYFQLVSDAYPTKIDLYWLSYQLLQGNTPSFTKDQEDIIRGLEQRYYNHCRKKE